jgi:hypothetical protein
MSKPWMFVIVLVILCSCSTQRPSPPRTAQTSRIKIDVSEDRVAVHAENVRFEALVYALDGALGVFKEETVLEFERDIADRIVSVDLDLYRSICTIIPSLEKVGRCRLCWTGPSSYSFKHQDAQDGPANGSQPIRSETNSTSSVAGSRR